MGKWGVRTERGGIEPVAKPIPVDLKDVPELRDNQGLKDMQSAIDAATSARLPGKPGSLIPTMSINKYEPPEDAIAAVMMGF